jgi:hypothetical protein
LPKTERLQRRRNNWSRQGRQEWAFAHGSIQAAASWPKLNGLINVLDGAGTHPGLSLIVARAFAATTEEKTSTISYKFKSEETTAVGSCVLQVIHGEIDATNDAARTSHTFQVYFPELQISATAVDAEPIVDSLSTVFSEIKPVN